MSSCTTPPQLSEGALLLHLDGDAGPDVAAHLDGCPHCRNRMLRLAEFQNGLRSRLNRIDCPSSMTLGEYQRGLLASNDRKQVAVHVASCPRCRAELAQLSEFLQAVAEPEQRKPGLAERAQVQIARFLSGSGPGRMSTAPVGIRGGQDQVWVFEAGESQITLRGGVSGMNGNDYTVVGLITGKDASGWEAYLLQKGKPVDTRPVDSLGNFIFHGIGPGPYDLVIEGGDQEIHIQDVEFRPA